MNQGIKMQISYTFIKGKVEYELSDDLAHFGTSHGVQDVARQMERIFNNYTSEINKYHRIKLSLEQAGEQ